jgi:sulfite exporter TauE/SafE
MKLTRWLGIVLGVLLIADGVAETVRLTRSGDGGLVFWFGTLVGGGALILVGTVLRARSSRAGWPLVVIGCIVGLVPTMWTIVVPLLLLALAVLTAREAAQEIDAAAAES